jgi:hypothetical protein
VGQQSELITNSLHAHQQKYKLLQEGGQPWNSDDAKVSAFIYIPPPARNKESASSSSAAASSAAGPSHGPMMVFADNACGILDLDIHRAIAQYEQPPAYEALLTPQECPFFCSNHFNFFGAGAIGCRCAAHCHRH